MWLLAPEQTILPYVTVIGHCINIKIYLLYIHSYMVTQ